MSDVELTLREREYLECDIPMISGGRIAKELTIGFLTGLLQAAFSPGYSKGDSRIIRTTRLMRYTKYKKSVLRKTESTPKKGDEKLLKKLNSQPFAMDAETDPDEFTARIYEEYMSRQQTADTSSVRKDDK